MTYFGYFYNVWIIKKSFGHTHQIECNIFNVFLEVCFGIDRKIDRQASTKTDRRLSDRQTDIDTHTQTLRLTDIPKDTQTNT